jgi:nucleotide-binding universal stress UspA family protein
MFKTILCPVDGSDHADKAMELSVNLAKASDATPVFVHVLLVNAKSAELRRFADIEGLAHSVNPELDRLKAVEGRLEYGYDEAEVETSRAYVEIGQRLLDEARDMAATAGCKPAETLMMTGDPADQILRAIADKGADCVVIGSRGLSDISALFLGSVSHKVLNRAPCTCIAVK